GGWRRSSPRRCLLPRRPSPQPRSLSLLVVRRRHALVSVLFLVAVACGGGGLKHASSTTVGGGGWASARPRGAGGEPLVAPTAPSTAAVEAVDLHGGGAPPWSGARVTAGTARQTVVDEWAKAANKATARAMLPADLALSPVAMPRPANFGGGWAVAWDDP